MLCQAVGAWLCDGIECFSQSASAGAEDGLKIHGPWPLRNALLFGLALYAMKVFV